MHWFFGWIHISKSAYVYYVSHAYWTASARNINAKNAKIRLCIFWEHGWKNVILKMEIIMGKCDLYICYGYSIWKIIWVTMACFLTKNG